jgi:CelD/BcsL family acetyltransferase involved in cellulose biosynthesis
MPASDREDASSPLIPCPVPFAAIPRATWDRLAGANPAATPFTRWTFHRAWWDAYEATAHEQYLACVLAPAAGALNGDFLAADGAIRGIVPLMHRHEVEPGDEDTATVLRRRTQSGTSVRPDAKAVFMAASYHADYATLLCAPTDMAAVAETLAASCCQPVRPEDAIMPWDVIDLRRLRGDDPALPALEAAFRRHAARQNWEVRVEIEDVCPVLTLPEGGWEAYLARLDSKARHEIRRKIRRAEASGPITFELAPLDAASVDDFIELHQARWGDEGLFPRTEGGDRSRRFLHRLTELEAEDQAGAQLQLGQVRVGDRLIFATVGFDDGTTCYFYNAGMDPAARDLSPGVTGTAAYLRDRLEAGRRRFDFLRGNEHYKYEWGAVDEPVHRLLVTRAVSA